MNAGPVALHGVLDGDNGRLQAEICGHSRFSFHIRSPALPADREAEYSNFHLVMNGREFDLGRCRFLPVDHAPSPEGRLVLLDDQIDIVELVGRSRMTVQHTGLFNLQMILAQQVKVHDSFKQYSANLTFEMSVYKQFFDELDRKYLKEPGPVQEHLQRRVVENEGREFMEFFANTLKDLQEETAGLSKDEGEAHGFFFRKQVWDFILHSKFMSRTNLKPRGYAGDYEMMRLIYANEYVGHTMFSQLMHKFAVEVSAAQAVRNRRAMLAHLVRRKAATPGRGRSLAALSIACGPAAELLDIVRSRADAEAIEFTLLDQDPEALHAALNNVQEIERRLQSKLRVLYINDSVRSMLRIQDLPGQWGRYDLVYSMGLFDYLTPSVARTVLAKLYQLLRPGGKLVIGNFHTENPDRTFMEYWLDWVLFYRTEQEFLDLASGLEGAPRRVYFDDTRCQMFLEVDAPL